jgi:hypothetical protein
MLSVSDLRWDDLRDDLNLELNGVLPDGCVPNTTVDDWQALLAVARGQGWRVELAEDDGDRQLRDDESLAFPGPEDLSVTLKIWPSPEIQVNFFMYDPSEITFDIDLRELQTQERLDLLCDFLRMVGRELRKPILITPEGASNALRPFMKFDPDLDRVVAVHS